MNISELFNKKKPVVSFEISPPKKDEALADIDGTLKLLAGLHPDFISVTFGAGGSNANSRTLEVAGRIKDEYGIEPLVHLTCLNYSKEEICTILEQMEKRGLNNILALRGDVNPDIKEKNDFKYANELITFIKERGNFGVSAACYPETHQEAPDAETDLRNLKKKVEAGAGHLVSQLFFDNSIFYDFTAKLKKEGIIVPVEAGIMPVTNRAQIEKMLTMCGASLPEKFRRILEKYGENREAMIDAGIVYALNQIIELLSHDVDGIHIYTMNHPAVVGRICEGLKNLI